jgi:2-polyprenyl-3-methyl-5-hydroxy-6-metoxy-1,4-benzoquinol methylase
MVSVAKQPYIQKCPHACQTDLIDSGIVMPEGPLRSCPACGQLLSACTEAVYTETSRYWDENTGTWPSEKDMRRLTRRRSRTLHIAGKIIQKDLSSSALLDVGCSNGAFLWIAAQLGMDAQGVEPGETPARQAQARGLQVHRGYLEKLDLPEDGFDIVTLFEVIEHLKNPIALVAACHRVLRPGGVLVIGTGNTDSWTCRFMRHRWDFLNINLHGGHINFYSTASVRVLAARTGFAVHRIRTSSVNIAEKHETAALRYRLAKLAAELLNLPSRVMHKGHQMEAFLVADKKR